MYNKHMEMRLDSFLSEYGVASRRKAKKLIEQGVVTVNGEIVTEVIRVDSSKDRIKVNNELIDPQKHKYRYIMFNKPLNVLSSTVDEWGRKTILDFVKAPEKVYPVGRLDYNSTGLILLTNDGDFSLKLTHPRYHLPKKYVVKTHQTIKQHHLDKLSKGVDIYDTTTIPAEVRKLGDKQFEIILMQGMKRQIREMCKVVGLTVTDLHRTHIGELGLGDLKPGEYRDLTNKEVMMLKG